MSAPRPEPAARSARRPRVLYLIDFAGTSGGAERFAFGLARSLSTRGFDLTVCATRASDPAAVRALAEAGVGHLELGRRGKTDIHRFRGLVALIRRDRFDVLHAHKFGSNLWGTLIGRACGIPVLIAHETTWSYEGEPLRRWLDGHVIGRLATRFIAVSDRDAERMISIEGVPAEKVVVMPNAHIPHAHSPDVDLRSELGIGPSTPLVATIAVLRPQKALSVLLDAFETVLRALPAAHLVIAGHGPCRAELEQQAARLGLEERVHFLGRRHDVDAILRSADLSAMSSDYEGMPLVAYECLVNGTPLVATNVGGLPDIIENGRTGTLVRPRDPEALAAAIVELLSDDDRRRGMARAAAARAPELSLDVAGRRFAELYTSLIEERARQAGLR